MTRTYVRWQEMWQYIKDNPGVRPERIRIHFDVDPSPMICKLTHMGLIYWKQDSTDTRRREYYANLGGYMPNRSKEKGDRYEREIVALAETMGLKAYRSFLSRDPLNDAVDVTIAGRQCQCKKEAKGFKRIRQWLERVDALVINSDREKSLVVVRLEDWLKLL